MPEQPAAASGPARTAHSEYAYQRRQGDFSRAHYHAVLDQPLHAGQLHRKTGDPLCRPRRAFWGLDPSSHTAVSCPTCIDRAQRYGVHITEGTDRHEAR